MRFITLETYSELRIRDMVMMICTVIIQIKAMMNDDENHAFILEKLRETE